MSVLFLLVPLALLVVVAALVGFAWAARQGQFDDLETPALRVVRDDAPRRSGAPERRPGENAS